MLHSGDSVWLRRMLDAEEKAILLSSGRSRQALSDDDMYSLAMTRLLEIIGEAAKAVGSEVTEAHPGVPWKQIAGVRDRLIHGYFNVDLDVVWSILTQDLPPLVLQLQTLLHDDC